MKYLIFILLISTSSHLYSQTVVDMAGDRQSHHLKNGQYYVKDVNNFMQPYLGTWRYVDGNEEFRIILQKETKYRDVDTDYSIDYYIDGLKIQYQKFENGNLIYSSNIDSYPTGIIKEFGKVNMSFTDYERNNEIFPVDLILESTGLNEFNKLKFILNRFERRNTYHDEHPNEPYFSVPNDITMERM